MGNMYDRSGDLGGFGSSGGGRSPGGLGLSDPISGAISGVAQGVGQYFSAKEMADAQRDANNQNAENVRRQIEFQKDMSNTAYQRAVADMKAAGLNPILAAKSPASSPSGAAAHVEAIKEPSLAGIGISSASGLADRVLDLSQKQASVAETESRKIASDAAAATSVASAAKLREDTEARRLENEQTRFESGSWKARGEQKKAQAEFDRDAAKYDAIMDRVGSGVGTITNAIGGGIRNLFRPSTVIQSGTAAEKAALYKAGAKGVPVRSK